MDQEISNAARAAGCSGYFSWEICPDQFASLLMSSVKRYARFLKDGALVKSHSAALETVAKAAGLPHWHAFSTIVQGLIDSFNAEVHWPRPAGGRELIKTLIPAFVFLVKASPDCAPSPSEQIGLSSAAEKLARVIGHPISDLLDMVGRMNGADTWAELLARKPEHSKDPLYDFQIDEKGNGRFLISNACAALIDHQDDLFQGFFSRPLAQQREFEVQLSNVLDARPDFLEGLLAKTVVLRFKPELRRQQGKIYTDALRQADDLIPVGFKGEISWHSVSNRFYHRLLYGAMIWHSHEGHTSKAVALARKQLRLNKSDNLGVRMWLPVLLCADGKITAAMKLSKKLSQDEDYSDAAIELVHAICYFANGDFQQSAKALYMSTFMYPPMRYVISVDFENLNVAINNTQLHRTVSPDAETLVEQYVSAAMRVRGLEETFDQWMNQPAVAHAENILESEFHLNWRHPNGSLDKWRADVKKQAELLANTSAIA